jgi:hypothetical protein
MRLKTDYNDWMKAAMKRNNRDIRRPKIDTNLPGKVQSNHNLGNLRHLFRNQTRSWFYTLAWDTLSKYKNVTVKEKSNDMTKIILVERMEQLLVGLRRDKLNF